MIHQPPPEKSIIGTAIAGRERFPINLRYPRSLRDSPEALGAVRVTLPKGLHVPLSAIARLTVTDGPAEVKNENGRLTGYVYVPGHAR